MKKIMPLTVSIMLILVAGIFAGAGSLAIFSDTETSKGNTFTAGTLDLKVSSTESPLGDDPYIVHFSLSDMKPGDETGYYKWVLKNVGSLTGTVTIEINAIANKENGRNEPEKKAGDTGPPGELGDYLEVGMGFGPSGWSCPSAYYGIWQGFNYVISDGWTYSATYTLGPNEEVAWFMKFSLDDDLTLWDGAFFIDVDDNIIQGDSLEFDIIFHLEQVD